MAAELGLSTPAGKIIVAGTVPIVLERTIETVANMYPGRLVKKGTTDRDVVVNDAGLPVGWLGYEQAAPSFKPATPATIYVVSDEAPTLKGGGFVILAKLATSQAIVAGDQLVPAADGMLKKATALVGTITAGATQVTGDDATPPVVITGDVGILPVVAIAEESVTTVGTAANIKVRSLI